MGTLADVKGSPAQKQALSRSPAAQEIFFESSHYVLNFPFRTLGTLCWGITHTYHVSVSLFITYLDLQKPMW